MSETRVGRWEFTSEKPTGQHRSCLLVTELDYYNGVWCLMKKGVWLILGRQRRQFLPHPPLNCDATPLGPPFQCSILGGLLWNEAIILFFFRHVGEFYIKILTFYLRRLVALE